MTSAPPPRTAVTAWDIAYFLAHTLAIAGTIYGLGDPYRTGSDNLDQSFGRPVAMLLGSCGMWACILFYGVFALVVTRAAVMKWIAYAFVALLPLLVGVVGLRYAPGAAEYRAGVAHWVSRVDPVPIQHWLATQKLSDKTVLVPPANWPDPIRKLHPELVDLWQDRGVALTWGRVGRDGDRRQLFVARTPETPPPTDVFWIDDSGTDAWEPIKDEWPAAWIQAKPGVWWWLIYGS